MFVSWFLLVIIALLVLSQHANNKDLQTKLFWANKDMRAMSEHNRNLQKKVDELNGEIYRLRTKANHKVTID